MNPRYCDHLAHARHVIDAVLLAADARRAVLRAWPRDLDDTAAPVYLLAIGKASLEMASGACERLGSRLAMSFDGGVPAGMVTAVPERIGRVSLPPGVHVLPADHPLPTARNIDAARAVQNFVGGLPRGATLLVLISGGGSAHLTLPREGLTLDDLRAATSGLQRAGAPIEELNAVRKHCERLKGGLLAAEFARAGGGALYALIVSDVMGDRLDVISSGPTAPDPTTYAQACEVLHRRAVAPHVPRIISHLEAGAAGRIPETPKPADPCFARVKNVIIASNDRVIDAALAAARELGFNTPPPRRAVQGEAAEAGAEFTRAALRAKTDAPLTPLALALGGETTVTVGGAEGLGGPSQEFALRAAVELEGHERLCIVAFSTDGIDGPTDAAGAIVTSRTVPRLRDAGIEPHDALHRHDSHAALARADALIRTGPTGTNVNHVAIALAYSK